MSGSVSYNIKKRISFLIFLSVAAILVLVGRLFYLQILRHDHFAGLAKSQYVKEYVLPAKRGRIYLKDKYANSGKSVVAMNNTLNLVYAVPKDIGNKKEEAAEKLSPIIKIPKEKILEMFYSSDYYVPLKHKLSDEESEAIKKLDVYGLVLVPESWRFWPEKSLLAQVLGFVNMDSKGQYGLEQEFDKELAGEPGQLKAETDAKGVKIASGDNVLIAPKDGDDIVLTIDKNIQANAEEVLKKAVESHKADSGSVIVMDPNAGGLLAMANYSHGQEEVDLNNYNKITDYSFFDNRALREYEPGSIFKLVTMASGLDSGKVKPSDNFEDKGSITIDGYKIMNSDQKAHGIVSMSYILEQSLNLGTTYIMQKLGRDLFYEYIAKHFTFGTKTGIELSPEDGGTVNKPNDVGEHTYASMSFGQALTVTPIQMTSAITAIANGGNLMRPRIIESFTKEGKKDQKKQKEVIKRVVSAEAAKDLTEMMVNTVERGHGKQAKVQGYKTAGKTGTAQVPDPKNGGYDPNKTIGSFVGFAPVTNPRFVVFAKIENPKDVVWAESTAAPVFHDIADNLLKYYQIPPDEK
jgi:cell division protein FtsI/penicillin-binding protein 2